MNGTIETWEVPRPAVLTDLDDSLITSHASGRDRRGWEPVVDAFAGFAAKQIRLHIVTLNGAPFVAGICNGIPHEAAETMLGGVHVGEGNVSLVIRVPRGQTYPEWCEVPILEPPPIECQLDRVRVCHLVARVASELRMRSVGMSLMVSYSVEPRDREVVMSRLQDVLSASSSLLTRWEVRAGGHPHIIDIVPERAANKGQGIAALLAHAKSAQQPIDISRSAWFGDSDADIKALEELTSVRRRSEGNAIGFVATHSGASAAYIAAVRAAPCPSFVSNETLAERAVPKMLAEYDRVIGLGVHTTSTTNGSHASV